MKNLDYKDGLNKYTLDLEIQGNRLLIRSTFDRDVTIGLAYVHGKEAITGEYTLTAEKNALVSLPELSGELPDSAVVSKVGEDHFLIELYKDMDIEVSFETNIFPINTMTH